MGKQTTRYVRKRVMAWMLIATIILSMSGCLRYRTEGVVHSDGTIDITILYATVEEDVIYEGGPHEDDELDEMRKNGWNVEEYYDSGDYDMEYSGYLISKERIPLDQLQQDLYDLDLGFGDFYCDRNGDVYTIKWSANEVNKEIQDVLGNTSPNEYGGFMEFSLTLPGQAMDDNAIRKEGNTLYWDTYQLDEPLYVVFKLNGDMGVRHETCVTISEDHKVNLELTYAVTESSDVPDLQDDIKDLMKSLKDNGFKVEAYNGKKKDQVSFVGFTASKKGISLEELEDELKEIDIGYDGFTCEKDGNTYRIKWDTSSLVKEMTGLGISSQSLSNLDGYMRFVLELPTEATKENADESDENILEWDFFEIDESIQAEFKLPDKGFPTWIILVIIGMIVAGGAVVGVLVLMRKKKTRVEPVVSNSFPVPTQEETSSQETVNAMGFPTQGGLPNPYMPHRDDQNMQR